MLFVTCFLNYILSVFAEADEAKRTLVGTGDVSFDVGVL
jgi:hypothetical protein